MPGDALPWSLGVLRPWLLLLLPAAWGLLIHARRPWRRLAAVSRASRRREATITALRLLLVTCLILGLAGLQAVRTVSDQAAVFAVDVSASMAGVRDEAAGWVRRALAERGRNHRAGIIAFGREARVEEPVTGAPTFDRPETDPGRHATDLAAALRLARGLFPDDARRRVILLTDGRENRGESIEEARRLAREGVRVDVVSLDPAPGPEVLIEGMDLAGTAYAGEETSLTVRLRSAVDTRGRLLLYRDDTLVAQVADVAIPAGETRQVLSVKAGPAGLHRYRVEVEPRRDAFRENNRAAALQRVLGTPQVLVVEGKPGEADTLRRALAATAVETRVVAPGQMPVDLAGWARYQAVFLVNIPAKALGEGAMAQIEAYVRDLGGGLVMVGGEDAFGLGGYLGTPVEKALPVYMDLRGRARQPTVGLLLVLDKSGSMAGMAAGADKMSIAREAAARSTEVLTPRDTVGVLAFDQAARWVFPPRRGADPRKVRAAIGGITPDGGSGGFFTALEEGVRALQETPAELKHMILLSDGLTNARDLEAVTGAMREANITLSTVEVNTCTGGCHVPGGNIMEALADQARGRFYHATDAAEIPIIFTKETMLATRSYIVNKTFTPALVSPGPLAGRLGRVANLDGYVATSPKERAEVVLVSPDGDPVLAAWQYGLGRAVAWTSDVRGRWSSGWVGSDLFPRLWGNVLSWLLPQENSGGLEVRVEARGGRGVITVDAGDLTAGAAPRTVVLGPGLERRELFLRPAGPGEYRGEFPAEAPGIYLVGVEQGARRAEAGLAVPYSPEYRDMGADRAFLQRLAAAGGGAVLADPAESWAANLPPVQQVRDLWPVLFTLACLLLPVDVGNRRFSFAAAAAAALAGVRRWRAGRRAGAEAAHAQRLQTAGRLKARKAQLRYEKGMAPPPPAPAAGEVRGGGGLSAGADGAPAAGTAQAEGAPGGDFTSRLLRAKRRAQEEAPEPAPPGGHEAGS